MKICIIGNSHVAALKLAWENHFDKRCKKDNDITFFASRGKSLRSLKLENNKLIPDSEHLKKNLRATSGGKSFIDLASYDVFLLYGLGVRPYYASNLFYSKAVIDDSIKDYYFSTLAVKILKMIKSNPRKKVYIGHNPMPNKNPYTVTQFRESRNGHYQRGMFLVNERFFGALGTELLKQPNKTISSCGMHTSTMYGKGALRLYDGKPFPQTDNSHMNEDFGKIWLDQFLSQVKNER